MYNLFYDFHITNIYNRNKIINNICDEIYYIWYIQDADDFKEYIKKLLQLSNPTFTIIKHSLIYIERIKKEMVKIINLSATCENYYLYCGHMIFTISLILGFKIVNDDNMIYNNSFWANILKIKVKNINKAEIQFLKMIKYNLFVN